MLKEGFRLVGLVLVLVLWLSSIVLFVDLCVVVVIVEGQRLYYPFIHISAGPNTDSR